MLRLTKSTPNSTNNQNNWDKIVNNVKKAAMKTVGTRPKTRKNDNNEIKLLSTEQKNIKVAIDNTHDQNKIDTLKNKRNKILTKIHQKLKQQIMIL